MNSNKVLQNSSKETLPNLGDESYSESILVKTKDSLLYLVDPEDNFIGKQLRLYGHYADDQLKILLEILDLDDSILVVGAHIGTLAIPLSKKCRRVIAIEANPNTYSLLVNNIALNKTSNCVPYNFAAQDKAGKVMFLLNKQNTGGSKIEPKVSMDMYYYDNPDTIEVAGFSLDDKFPTDRFDLIIMDIEGSEYYALKGMFNILTHVKCLMIEFLPHHIKYVSGVSVKPFYELLDSFEHMYIPSIDTLIEKDQILSTLELMYEQEFCEDGLIFLKAGYAEALI